jgi:hypothetical protein
MPTEEIPQDTTRLGSLPSPSTIEVEALPSEELDEASGPSRYELFTYPADFTLEVLHQKWKNGDIIIPPIQRTYVWSQLQASRLVESFLLGLPVPGVFLYVERNTERFLVVDGQQRLRSVFYFFEGYFGDERLGKKQVFRLTLPDNTRWAGKTFADLREDDALRLKNSVLRAFVMKQVNPADDTSIYHVFERLNTGGTSLTAQEVRNSVDSGPFNDLMRAINADTISWREILGRPIPDPRLRDVELILRFFALFKGADSYEKPMKSFLTAFQKKHKAGDLDAELGPLFIHVSNDVRQHLGPRPFHLHKGLNVPVFDAVFVAFARNTKTIPAEIATRYQTLLADATFQKWTSRATTDVEAVKNRLSAAQQILFP